MAITISNENNSSNIMLDKDMAYTIGVQPL